MGRGYDPALLDVVPLDAEDTSMQITNLGESSRAQIQRTPGALITGALVNDASDNGLVVGLVGDADLASASGVAPGLLAHLVSVQGNNGLLVAIPVDVAGTIGISEPGGLADVLDRGGKGIAEGDDRGLGNGRFDDGRDGGGDGSGGRGGDGAGNGGGRDERSNGGGDNEEEGGELGHDERSRRVVLVGKGERKMWVFGEDLFFCTDLVKVFIFERVTEDGPWHWRWAPGL